MIRRIESLIENISKKPEQVIKLFGLYVEAKRKGGIKVENNTSTKKE